MSKFVCALTLTVASVAAGTSDIWKVPDNTDDLVWNETQVSGGLGGKPGLKVRIGQRFVNLVHNNLIEYGAAYINYGYQFPTEGQFSWNVFPVSFNMKYKNLSHDPIRFDLTKFHFDFAHSAVDGSPILFAEIPMIKNFGCDFDYELALFGGLITDSGKIRFEERDIKALTTLHLAATDRGHVYPQIEKLVIGLGNSSLTEHKNFVKEYIYKTTFNLLKHILVNAVNTFGKSIYNPVLPEYFRRFLNGQVYNFSYSLDQLSETGFFNIDYALIVDPLIHNNVLDLEFLMDIGA